MTTMGESPEGAAKKYGELTMEETAEIRTAIVMSLRSDPGSTATQISGVLSFHRSTINSTLYSCRDLFTSRGSAPPRWWLANESPSARIAPDLPAVTKSPDGEQDEVDRDQLNRNIERFLRSNGSMTAVAIAEELQFPQQVVDRHLHRFPKRYVADSSDPRRWDLVHFSDIQSDGR